MKPTSTPFAPAPAHTVDARVTVCQLEMVGSISYISSCHWIKVHVDNLLKLKVLTELLRLSICDICEYFGRFLSYRSGSPFLNIFFHLRKAFYITERYCTVK